MSHAPSKKQIDLADNIAKILNLDFPKGSYDFTSQAYWQFIHDNIEEYKYACAYCEDDANYGLLGEYDDWDLYELGLWEF